MFDGQSVMASPRGARGRRKSRFRFSSRKSITRSRLQRELKLNECRQVGEIYMATNSNNGLLKNRDCNALYNDAITYNISSVLSTVQELNFESSGEGQKDRGFSHSKGKDERCDEVC
jgi:hypothetical protein